MSYAPRKSCPACGTAIQVKDVDDYITECKSCLRLWDVTEL